MVGIVHVNGSLSLGKRGSQYRLSMLLAYKATAAAAAAAAGFSDTPSLRHHRAFFCSMLDGERAMLGGVRGGDCEKA